MSSDTLFPNSSSVPVMQAPAAQSQPAPQPADAPASGGMSEMPSWVVSCIVHFVLLFIFWQLTYVTNTKQDATIETVMLEEEPITPEDFKFDATINDSMGSDSPLNTLSPSLAAATQAGENPQKDLDRELDEDNLQAEQPVADRVTEPNRANLVENIDTTGTTEHTGGIEGSIDRLTYEIAGSLKERKTLAIWLFDASLSLEERRETIANRFENVYRQLGQLEVNSDRALKTAVASFGSRTNIITPEPIDDVTEIVEAIRGIPADETGKENVFAAVTEVANKWGAYRTKMHRNVMIIVVTDERGDDYARLESTIQLVRRQGLRVFCVGNSAPFGREKGSVLWRYEDGSTEYLDIDAGPETVAAERLRLGFWGGNGNRLDEMSSGFGPYALTRLCAESKGLYLLTDESSRGPKFDPEVMRAYQPDYSPIRIYDQQLKTNRAKGALVATARQTQAVNIINPQLAFRADSDTVLRQEITEAQKPAAVFDYQLIEMSTMLEQGEKDRDKLTDFRWRASYDLAMGRVLAMRVRAFGYNTVLAEMKSTPKSFEKQGSNRWRLVPSREIEGGPTVKKLAKKAKEYLMRVIDDHPGTPWALLAERELSQELGWAWQEYRVAPPAMNGGNNANPNDLPAVQFADEEARKQAAMKRAAQQRRVKPTL